MPIVTVHVTEKYYIKDSTPINMGLDGRLAFTYDFLQMLPAIVASALESLGITGIKDNEVMVVFKKFHPLCKNAPNIWVNLATGERTEPSIKFVKIALGNSIRNWVLENYPMENYPTIDVECEYRQWSGVSFDDTMTMSGEW